MSNTLHYEEIFDYLSAPVAPQESTGLLVFGRKDPIVAHKAGELVLAGLGNFVVITGGKGKDSGDLAIPESTYLKGEFHKEYPELRGVPLVTETEATNGGENVRNSLALMDDLGYPYNKGLTTVSHATSARRLGEMTKHGAQQRGTPIDQVYRVPSDYAFNPENPADQKEARDELLRLAEWPDKGWLGPQPDLPQNLVDFALDIRNQQQ